MHAHARVHMHVPVPVSVSVCAIKKLLKNRCPDILQSLVPPLTLIVAAHHPPILPGPHPDPTPRPSPRRSEAVVLAMSALAEGSSMDVLHRLSAAFHSLKVAFLYRIWHKASFLHIWKQRKKTQSVWAGGTKAWCSLWKTGLSPGSGQMNRNSNWGRGNFRSFIWRRLFCLPCCPNNWNYNAQNSQNAAICHTSPLCGKGPIACFIKYQSPWHEHSVSWHPDKHTHTHT